MPEEAKYSRVFTLFGEFILNMVQIYVTTQVHRSAVQWLNRKSNRARQTAGGSASGVNPEP
ncbi:MAG TPA: hypothetical protein DER10_04045 [Elusimicrobia bacterium]|nr:MAG: hypothetical protein A2X33_06200 [Elusimicrobia bacterium GWA2_51_34]HCE97650.1 hypothetical protein [Elusimicrobiota bacterium]